MPLPPKAEFQWWYQFYFATERGRARLREDTGTSFNKLIWQLASPKWNFDDATFDRSAAAFDNPDHVAIVIHNYRWRLGLAEGEPKFDELEKRLATGPGDHACRPSPWRVMPTARRIRSPAAYAKKFSGKYEHRLIKGGIGHNLPQEAPQGLCPGRDRRRRSLIEAAAASRANIRKRNPP